MRIKSLEHFTEADFTRIVITLYPLVEAAGIAEGEPHDWMSEHHQYYDRLVDLGEKVMTFFEENSDD